MSGRLNGRVAVVTGAAQGIGSAYASKLASEGALVAVLDVADASHPVAEIEVAGSKGVSFIVDVADPFVVSDDAAFVPGQTFYVDGGLVRAG